jgi:hypothetical protein
MARQSIFGQRIQWKSFIFTEENEFFNIFQHGIDRFYTQGLKLEFTYQVSNRKILEKLVIPISSSSTNIYSLSIFQRIYTPGRTDKYFYKGDHPYGGSLVLTEGLESYDSAKQLRVNSRLDAGVIGPASLGRRTQDLFHFVINNNPTVAWETQMRNDIYLNYFVKVEKAITQPGRKFRVEWKSEFNLGTALISTVPGLNIEYGTWYNSEKKNAWQIFFRPELRIIAFNAMLQGGIINQNFADEFYSQYLFDDIKLLVYSHSTGIRYRHNRFEAMFRQVNLTREYAYQRAHYYSTIWVSMPLKRKKK